MAASIYPDWPPKISPEQQKYLLDSIKDWSIANGLAVRPSPAFVSQEVDPTGVLAVTAPVTLFPSPFPRACFNEALDIQCAYDELYAAIARDEDWLGDVIQELVEVDEFIAKLWQAHLAVKQEGDVQNISLGISRSDYLVHIDNSTPSAPPQIRQVEFNTIAASFAGLSSQVSLLHKHLAAINAYPSSPALTSSSLPPNPTIPSITSGLVAAHNIYGPSKFASPLPLCILFIVQLPERNIFDQHHLSAYIQSHHQIPTFRLPFASVLSYTSIPSSDPSRPLIYTPPHSPSTPYEVSLVYYRAAYDPIDYPSDSSWEARIHLERSAAIKAPSILGQLAGTKKVQQVLATPGSPHLSRFLPPDLVDGVRKTFAPIFPLDDSPPGKEAKRLAMDPDECKKYVLKPQREGGGHNVYRSAIPEFLKKLGSEEKWRGYILMEIIEPPALRNSIFREGVLKSGEVIGELGVYGVCLWEQGRGGEKGKVHENSQAGFLLRTKGRESEEGGVAAGFACVDSICLVDV